MDVHPASVQDRDGAVTLLREARKRLPFIEHIICDGGYQGPKMAAVVKKTGAWTLQIVKRSDLGGFVVLPKRWIVERTLAWISRNRRLCRDYERHARKAVAYVRLAMIALAMGAEHPLVEQALEEHGAQAGLERLRVELGVPRADRLARLVQHAYQCVGEIAHLVFRR